VAHDRQKQLSHVQGTRRWREVDDDHQQLTRSQCEHEFGHGIMGIERWGRVSFLSSLDTGLCGALPSPRPLTNFLSYFPEMASQLAHLDYLTFRDDRWTPRNRCLASTR